MPSCKSTITSDLCEFDVTFFGNVMLHSLYNLYRVILVELISSLSTAVSDCHFFEQLIHDHYLTMFSLVMCN